MRKADNSAEMAVSYSSRPLTQAKKARSSPPSQIKGTRFTEEDAKLIDMRERKHCSWNEIDGAFPGRT